jgi:NADPH:quinone reductase-like Zn-dependent oxidoreductase
VKAQLLTAFGNAEGLVPADVPTPGPGQLLVRTAAIGLE